MNEDRVEALIEGLIVMMTDDAMCQRQHQFTERQIELIRAYKLGWVKSLPDSDSLGG